MNVPQFKDPAVTNYLVQLQREHENEKRQWLSAIKANKSLLLFAPNLSVWEVTVTNAGALVTTKIAG